MGTLTWGPIVQSWVDRSLDVDLIEVIAFQTD